MSASPSAWLEVSLTFETSQEEEAEAVAQVLARLSQGRVVWSYEQPRVDARDWLQDLGPTTLRAYLPLEEPEAQVRRRVEEALWHLHVIRPLPPARFRVLAEQDWMQAWKRFYRPIPVGNRFLVLPAWMEPPATERLVIRIEPGTAFGTGMHPSTRLCLQALEDRVRPGQPFMDVGCGSGILSIAAALLGAQPVVALDIDPEALEATRANARLNRVEQVIHPMLGSVEALLVAQGVPRQAPLVVANILAEVLVELLEQGLDQLVMPEGELVLSGILEEREPLVHQAARARGLVLVQRLQEGEWVALVWKKSPGSSYSPEKAFSSCYNGGV